MAFYDGSGAITQFTYLQDGDVMNIFVVDWMQRTLYKFGDHAIKFVTFGFFVFVLCIYLRGKEISDSDEMQITYKAIKADAYFDSFSYKWV